MKTLFLALLALSVIAQAQPQVADNIERLGNAAFVSGVAQLLSGQNEQNSVVTQADWDSNGIHHRISSQYMQFLRDNLTEQERIYEISDEINIVINQNPFNANSEYQQVFKFIGLATWNRKIHAWVEREIERGTIPAEVAEKYVRFKNSQVWRNLVRQVLEEFGFQDIYAAEQHLSMVRDINSRLIYYLIHDHAESFLELIALKRAVFPFLVRSLELQTPATR